jgi:hypothetical protein
MLLNKINTIVSHITEGNKILHNWRGSLQQTVSDMYRYTSQYLAIQNQLENLAKTSHIGMMHLEERVDDDDVVRAKEKIKYSKTIKRKFTTLKSIEASIRKLLHHIQTELRLFNLGFVKLNNRELFNLLELANEIDHLDEQKYASLSPLKVIQKSIAQHINSANYNYNYATDITSDILTDMFNVKTDILNLKEREVKTPIDDNIFKNYTS